MTDPLLKVRDVTVRFGGVIALANLSFEADPGRITALIGPNGAGKTTAVNAVSGIRPPDRGRIVFDDVQIQGRPAHRIATMGLTRTFQNLRVFTDMTVLENVMVGCHGVSEAGFVRSMFRLGTAGEERRIRERALAALDRFGLADRANWLAGRLAYGQQKRIELARAAAARPKLVLLDEPTAGLNAAETETMAGMILGLRRAGTAVLLVEHDMNLVMSVSDRVVVMNHGQRIAHGTPEEVQADEEVIDAYLGREAGW